jgi:hypothetical protein
MAETLLLNQPFVTSGLDTLNYTVPSAGLYYVNVQLTEVPPSGLSVVVNQNGSPVFTSPALSPTQIAQQFKYAQAYAAADAISVVISSASAVDSVINNVKSTITVGQGQ